MGVEAAVTTTIPAEGQPTPEEVGLEILTKLGLDAEASDRMGRIELSAGGKCVGTLAQFIGVERHAEIRDGVVTTIQAAQETGANIEDAVAGALGLFVRRHTDGEKKGELVRSDPVPKLPEVKKN